MRKWYSIVLVMVVALHGSYTKSTNFTDDEIYVKAFCQDGNTRERIGVTNVSYLMSPADTDDLFLTLKNSSLFLGKNTNKQSSFYFEKDEVSNHYVIKNVMNPDFIVGNLDRNKCMIRTTSDETFQLRFKCDRNDSRPSVLTYKQDINGNYNVATKNLYNEDEEKYGWKLRPCYEFPSLKIENIDLDTLLFKIPRKDQVSQKLLSKSQMQALYSFYSKDDPDKQLTIINESDFYFYAYTPVLSYIDRLRIISADFSLRIFGIKGYEFSIDDRHQIDSKNLKISDNDIKDVSKGSYFHLKPVYNNNNLSAIGNLEIAIGEEGIIWSATYERKFLLKTIFENKFRNGQKNKGFSSFIVNFNDDANTIDIINSNKNPWLNPGRMFYLAGIMFESLIEKLGKQVERFAAPLAKSIEDHGRSIEEASQGIKKALTIVSKDFSSTANESVKRLTDTLNEASRTFENTLQQLSQDVTCNTRIISTDIIKVSDDLNNTLTEVSEDLKTESKDFSKSLVESSKLFTTALEQLSHIVEERTKEGGTLDVGLASRNFVTGMQKIENAAMALRNVNHNHTPKCIIS